MPTITQAQNNAGNIAFIANQGISKSSSPRLSTMEAMLALYAEEFVVMANDILKAKGKNNTGDLGDSIDFQLTETGTAFSLKLLVLDYYEYVDQGVRGRNPKYNVNNTSPFKYKYGYGAVAFNKSHTAAILKWLKEGRPKSTSQDVMRYGAVGPTERKSLSQQDRRIAQAKRIAYFVKRKGTERTGFWTDSFDKTFKDFAIQMSKALGVDVQVDLQQLVQGIKKKR